MRGKKKSCTTVATGLPVDTKWQLIKRRQRELREGVRLRIALLNIHILLKESADFEPSRNLLIVLDLVKESWSYED